MKWSKRTWAVLALLCVVCGYVVYAGYARWRDDPQQHLTQVVFPASFAVSKDNDSAQAAAKRFADQPRYFMSAKVNENGDIVTTMTQDQLEIHINDNKQKIDRDRRSFLKDNPDYRYEYDAKTRTFSFYVNKNLSTNSTMGAMGQIPYLYGTNYYLEGGKGDWVYQTVLYNCHTNQEMARGTSDKKWTFKFEELGD
ncbi:hypothetical protein KIM372_15660 [Bombiscardovia nodaiensis]|uniref:Uncharacterized protein n=1 Tax=Bombiscardovia nodaiensis TaxID=2932181 RepID=A0ABM8B9T5_9BIFI|nr:hypothetical protein KIM372_15660 [Bombiscardovia nodaiensis]